MIVKYRDDGVWNYIDDIYQATATGMYFPDYLITTSTLDEDRATCNDCNEEVKAINEAWTGACYIIRKKMALPSHANNLITSECIKNNLPIGIIGIKRNGQDEYSEMIVTCQEVYLMNDNGKTIERLV